MQRFCGFDFFFNSTNIRNSNFYCKYMYVNRRAKKLDLVKRSDLCVKTCSVNAAKEALNPNTNAMKMQDVSPLVMFPTCAGSRFMQWGGLRLLGSRWPGWSQSPCRWRGRPRTSHCVTVGQRHFISDITGWGRISTRPTTNRHKRQN